MLSPELRALAEEFGLFGLTVGKTAEQIAADQKKIADELRVENRNALGREIQQLYRAGASAEFIQGHIDRMTPSAQHGGIVLPRMGGTMVNVGEAGRAEAIIPLPDLAALA